MVSQPISCTQFASVLRGASDYLAIDCRSFLVFNQGRVRNAINIRSNSILRRRSRGEMCIENVISSAEKRKLFSEGNIKTVIVYDENGDADQQAQKYVQRRTTSTVLTTLLKHSSGQADIRYLSGGFKLFQVDFPELCEGLENTLSFSNEERSPGNETPATPTPIYDQGSPVEILPHLYLGSAHHASQENELAALGITGVLNASSHCPNHFPDRFQYKRIPVEDNGQADISSWFDEAISFINEEKQRGGKVFVHCHAGISRSATICLAYLITCRGVSLNDAFRYVKSKRSVISPNFNFMGQLSSLEAKLSRRPVPERIQSVGDIAAHLRKHGETLPMEWTCEADTPETVAPVAAKPPSPQSRLYRRRAVTAAIPIQILSPLKPANKTAMPEDKRCMTAPVLRTDFAFQFPDKRDCKCHVALRILHCQQPAFTLST
uniref:Dual specificity phosphatase n=1 Tax=Ciona intestinalis TaxID=7719 RepID=Q4H3P4_CIOIN|nr:dual specificity phosphatase [Ciona intestinalis]BAE06383.1 dual specificity phosphatase [Ciona intestinalis]|eukprot:NP_001071947.1 dual specificity phosphatase [Ciona intestinalis]